MRAQTGKCEVEVDLYTIAKLAKKAGQKDMTVPGLVSFFVKRFIEPTERASKQKTYSVAQ